MHLILHMGPSKTGSSAIQVALHQNKDVLSQHGIHMTKTSGHDLCFRYRYSRKLPPKMERRFGSLEQMVSRAEEEWQKFEAEVHENKYETVIVSSEDIPSAKLRDDLVRRLQKSFDKITGILYFRDPVDLYISELNQRIRHGLRFRHAPTPVQYKYRHLEFAEWFTSLAGRDALVTRNFDRANLKDENVVSDFFDIIEKTCRVNIDFKIPSAPVNPSLTGAATTWMFSFNEILDRRIKKINKDVLDRRSDVIKKLRHSETVSKHEKLRLTDPELQAVIRQNAAADMKIINEKYLQGQVPLNIGNHQPVELTQEQARDRMREWLLGYMTPEAVSDVTRELLS